MRYGYWRTDKKREEGFSYEFISSASQTLIDGTGATLDDLHGLDEHGVDTLLKAFHKTCERYFEHPWLGTRNKDAYQWITF